MAIEIIDGFKLNRATPIDDRMVASGSTARDAIGYKYEGMRVFDTSDTIPYVWLNNSWVKENKQSLSADKVSPLVYIEQPNYTKGQVLKVSSNNNTLTNSIISEFVFKNPSTGAILGNTVAISQNTSYLPNQAFKLDVDGSVKATSFSGSGANLTLLDPANFDPNKFIPVTKLQINGNNKVLSTDSSGNVAWEDLATAFTPASISLSQYSSSDPNLSYLTIASQPTNSQSQLKYVGGVSTPDNNGNILAYRSDTNQLVLKNDTNASNPAISFYGELSSGIYRSGANKVGISISGTKTVEVDSNVLRVPIGSSTTPGSALPGLSFMSNGIDTKSGIFYTTNYIGVSIGGYESHRFNTGGVNGGKSLIEFITNYDRYDLGIDDFVPTYVNSGWVGVTTSNIGFTNNTYTTTSIGNYTGGNSIALTSAGSINIKSNIGNSYGTVINNNGGNFSYSLKSISTFATGQLDNAASAGRVLALFSSKIGTTEYPALYVTSQGILLHGYSGVGSQTNFSGTAAKPSLSFMGSGTTGLYSDSDSMIGFTSFGNKRMQINQKGVNMASFESQVLSIPTFTGIQNASSANNTFNGNNSACINATFKTLVSNNGAYTARWIYLGFKFNSYTATQGSSTVSQQSVSFAAETCDRVFYCGVGGNAVSNWLGYEAKFYIGGIANGNYLGRFVSNDGSSHSIYTGSGTFYIPAGHVFTILFEFYSNGSAVNDTSAEGNFGMSVRAFRMGIGSVN